MNRITSYNVCYTKLLRINNMHSKIKFFKIGMILSVLTTIVLGITQNETLWIISRIVAGFGTA